MYLNVVKELKIQFTQMALICVFPANAEGTSYKTKCKRAINYNARQGTSGQLVKLDKSIHQSINQSSSQSINRTINQLTNLSNLHRQTGRKLSYDWHQWNISSVVIVLSLTNT